MSTPTLQRVGQEKPERPAPPTKRQIRRPKNGTESAETGCRFFLAKPGGSGESPVFGREFSKEGEAMVEALKSGITYYVVTERRPVADLSGKTPQVRRETVIHKHAGWCWNNRFHKPASSTDEGDL